LSLSRSRSFVLLFAVITFAVPAVFGQAAKLEMKPYSGSVLMSRAILAGRVKIPTQGISATIKDALTCSPAPCALPDVQASENPSPNNEHSMAASVKNPMQLATSSNDYNCSTSLQGLHTSSDGGTTWKSKCLNVLKSNSGLGDIVVGYDLNGKLWAVGINSPDGGVTGVIGIQSSINNGTTLSAAKTAVKAVLGTGGLTDKPWLEVDDNAASPFKNSLYVSVTQFATNNNSQISVTSSHNGGSTFKTVFASPLAVFPKVAQFSDIAVGGDGTVYLTYMTCTANGPTGNCGSTTATMWFQKSTDGGATWSKAVSVAKVKLAPDSCGAFYGCLPNTNERVSNIPAIAVDASTGPTKNKLYVVMYTYTSGKQMKVQVASSTNGGTTWSAPKVPAGTAKHDQFFPWIRVSSTGTVGVSWLDRRNDAANINWDAFAAFSTNGGTSYSANLKLSSAVSNPNNDGFGGTFMGDYTGSAWSGLTLYTATMDTRSGVCQDEVGGSLQ
jgi:hypothetical protein